MIGGEYGDREGNVVAFNHGNAGIIVTDQHGSATGNSIRGNSIYQNGGLGIDLAPFSSTDGIAYGLTANDEGDGDAGPNGLQNFPEISGVTTDGPSTFISGTIDSGSPERPTRSTFSRAPRATTQGTARGRRSSRRPPMTAAGGRSARAVRTPETRSPRRRPTPTETHRSSRRAPRSRAAPARRPPTRRAGRRPMRRRLPPMEQAR